MSHCHCGEFDRPTIAPDEFGETCFHERDKCEVPPVPVPIETVLRLTRARAERAEAERDELRAQVQRVRELPILGKAPQGNTALRGYNDGWNACRMATLRAFDGDGDE